MTRFGAVELGGTKTVVAVAEGLQGLADHVTIPTTTPDETLDAAISHLESGGAEAVGIASFGPVELDPAADSVGYITRTPKPGWSHTPVLARFSDRLGVPVGFDTDVNGAALGEGRWGAGVGLGTFVYITVGTGIGGGVIANGRPVHGAPHPEVGHVIVRRHPDDDHEGSCPFHGDCLEGMAAGPAMERRFGKRAEDLTDSEQERALELAAFYLAQGFRSLVYVVAPERIIVGGGVSRIPGLHAAVREELIEQLSGYPGVETHRSETFVVPPELGDLSGLAGALLLAERAFE